jgi:hypothetical protein
MRGSIDVSIERRSPQSKYLIEAMFNILGIKHAFNKKSLYKDPIKLYYGNHPKNTADIVIPEAEADDMFEDVGTELLKTTKCEQLLNIDFVTIARKFLTDQVNNNNPKDTHSRLSFVDSFQRKNNIGTIPVVSKYVNEFRKILKTQFDLSGIPLWPKGKRCAIGLSHDVDVPERFAIQQIPIIQPDKKINWHIKIGVRKLKAAGERICSVNPNNNWLFDDIMAEEEKYGFKSTYFFSSINSAWSWGSPYDVDYDITQNKYRSLLEEIKNRGFDVGLHASYNAYKQKEYLLHEKNRLEEALGATVHGLRHHYWHLGDDVARTLRFHEVAGFEYDSSIAFRDSMGFRRSIAYPFYPWDPVLKRPLHVMQLPVFCMDAHIFVFGLQPKHADPLDQAKECIQQIKQHQGLGVLNWHVRTSYPGSNKFHKWGKSYIELLKYLANDSEIWITSLSEINDWVRKRGTFNVD